MSGTDVLVKAGPTFGRGLVREAAGVLDGGQRVDHAPGHASGDRADGLPERLQLLRVCSAAAFFRNNAILGTMQY